MEPNNKTRIKKCFLKNIKALNYSSKFKNIEIIVVNLAVSNETDSTDAPMHSSGTLTAFNKFLQTTQVHILVSQAAMQPHVLFTFYM